MSEEKLEHSRTEVRMTEVMGVPWRLMLSYDVDEWVVQAETEFGDSPEPFRTTDEAEARDVFGRFEELVAGAGRPEDDE